MNDHSGYCVANAYLDDQITILGDHDGLLEPVEAGLTAREVRDLAFRLLMLAELADHRARGEQS